MSFLTRLRSLSVQRSTRRAASRIKVIENLDPSDMKEKLNTARTAIVNLHSRMDDAEAAIVDLQERVTALEGGS